MANESQQTPDSPPDPTGATSDAIARAIRAERDWTMAQIQVLDQRLAGIDEATKLRWENIKHTPELIAQGDHVERDWTEVQLGRLHDQFNERLAGIDKATIVFEESLTRVPTDVQREVGHLKELTVGLFSAVEQRFTERDTRSERESRDNKVAVDAAFAAQKEASAKQNESNTLAIAKSETATAETINKMTQLFSGGQAALNDKVDDLKERIGKLESLKQGGHEAYTGLYALAGFILTAIAIISAIVAFKK